MVQMDATDRLILAELQRDSRQTYAEVGAKVGLSAASVHGRVKNLERRGVIKGYGAHVSAKAVGLEVVAFIAIRLEGGVNCRDVAPALALFPEVEECHSVAGDVDSLVKVRVSTPDALEQLLFRIKKLPGVQRTISTITLSTQFEYRPLLPTAEGETSKAALTR